MKFALQLNIVFLLASFQNKELQKPIIEIDLTKDIVKPKHYIVGKISDSLLIDGKDLDSAWLAAPFSNLFVDIEGLKQLKEDFKIE